MGGFRPLRKGGKAGSSSKHNDDDGDDSSASDQGFARGGTTPGSEQDAAESGVPVNGEGSNHYQYNVDSYDSYDSGSAANRAGGRAGVDDGSYERGQGEDGGSAAVQRQRARVQQKRKCLIGGAVVSSLVILAGAAVGGYFIWDTQFRDNGTTNQPENPDVVVEDDGDLQDTNVTNTTLARYCALLSAPSPSAISSEELTPGLRRRRRMQLGEDDMDNINYLMQGSDENEATNSTDNNMTASITTTIATDIRDPTCHPEQVMCTSDDDCANAFGTMDGVLYGSCVDKCSTQDVVPEDEEEPIKYCAGSMSPSFSYDGGENGPKATGRKERERTICHPTKVVCTSDTDCSGMSYEHSDGSMVSTGFCTSECEDFLMSGEPPSLEMMPMAEVSNFTTILTLADREDCVLSLEEQALFCKGVSDLAAGSGTSGNETNATALSGDETNSTDAGVSVVPDCEVLDQECLSSLIRRNLLRKRSLQGGEGTITSVELFFQLSWPVATDDTAPENTAASTSYTDDFLEYVSSPSSTFSDDLSSMLTEESGGSMEVVTVSTPELYIVDIEVDGTNITSNATNITELVNVTALGYCGFPPEDSYTNFDSNSSCTDVPCEEDSDCMVVEGGMAMSCLELCLPVLNNTMNNETLWNNETSTNNATNTTWEEEEGIFNETSSVRYCGYLTASASANNSTNSSSFYMTNSSTASVCHESYVECSSDDDCLLLDMLEESVLDGIVYTCLESCANEPLDDGEDFADNDYYYNEAEITFNTTNTTNTTDIMGESQLNQTLPQMNSTYPELNETIPEMNITMPGNTTNNTIVNATEIDGILDSLMNGYCGYQVPSMNEDAEAAIYYGGEMTMENVCDASGQRCFDDDDCSVAGDGLICLETCASKTEEYYYEEVGVDHNNSTNGNYTDNATISTITNGGSSRRCAIQVEPDPANTDLVYTSAGVALSCVTDNDYLCYSDSECIFELGITTAVCVSDCNSSSVTNTTRI